MKILNLILVILFGIILYSCGTEKEPIKATKNGYELEIPSKFIDNVPFGREIKLVVVHSNSEPTTIIGIAEKISSEVVFLKTKKLGIAFSEIIFYAIFNVDAPVSICLEEAYPGACPGSHLQYCHETFCPGGGPCRCV